MFEPTIASAVRKACQGRWCAFVAGALATTMTPAAENLTDDGLPALLANAAAEQPSSNAGAEPWQPQQATTAPHTDTIVDIVVTARRLAEPLQSVPLSITAVTADSLRVSNVQTVAGAARLAPNLVFEESSRNSGGSSQIFMRGVGQTDFIATADPGVGLYLDGVYYARAAGSVLDVVDVERIEILRGPQGTLFGKNTIGGAINIISARPSEDFGAYVEATAGRFEQRDVRASIDMPLGSNASARLSVSSRNRDGWARSLQTGADLANIDRQAARMMLAWTPTESLDVRIAADANRFREDSFLRPNVISTARGGLVMQLYNALVAPTTPYGRYDERWLTTDLATNNASGSSASDIDSGGVSVQVDYHLNDRVTLESITAYRELQSDIASDSDGSPLDLFAIRIVDDQQQLSQELRLNGSAWGDRLQWQLGAYYFREEIDQLNSTRGASGLFDALEALPTRVFGVFGTRGNPFNVGLDIEIDQLLEPVTSSYALFTQETLALTDTLSLTAGLRYSYEKKDITGSSMRLNAGVPVLPPNTTLSADWYAMTPRVSLEFKPMDELLLYASYAQGFKSGGFNPRPQRIEEFRQIYDPEEVATYEAGIKTDLLGRRLRINAAAFYSDYTDLQLFYRVPAAFSFCPASSGSGCFVNDNAGKARLWGGELEITARPSSRLSVNASAGYLGNEIRQLDAIVLSGGAIDLDTKLPKAPKWTLGAGIDYNIPLGDLGELRLSSTYAYRSETFQDYENTAEIASPAYGLLGARASFSTAGDRCEVALAVSNLTDKRYLTAGSQQLSTFGFSGVSYGDPRTWSLSVRVNFGSVR